MEYELTCPLGSKCEEIKNNKNYRCAWYTQLKGRHPQTGDEVDEWGCAMAWLPVLQIETSGNIMKVQAATDKVATNVSKVSAPKLEQKFQYPMLKEVINGD